VQALALDLVQRQVAVIVTTGGETSAVAAKIHWIERNSINSDGALRLVIKIVQRIFDHLALDRTEFDQLRWRRADRRRVLI
jgi:hypothetical protein